MLKEQLIDFINESPTAFNAVDNLKRVFLENNFIELKENEKFLLEKGKNYFVTRNNSALIAFKVGKYIKKYAFKIVASHVDSPCFKIKPISEGKTDIYNKINIEPYGGMINSTWLDRPLSIAGRVSLIENNILVNHVVNIKKPVLMIPNLCIHFNRQINSGYAYNHAIDMQPMIGQENEGNNLISLLLEELKVESQQILNYDLFAYNFEKGYLWGKNNEYISSPRLDDLECAFISQKSFLSSNDDNNIDVCVFFDNEEVGSTTIQGANSDFLFNVLKRVNFALNYNEEDFICALADSYLVSSDNAHAVHPNRNDMTDPNNKVYMNKGIVIKFNASQSYTTDGSSASYIQNLCQKNHIPYQFFTNRSDVRGGSTLGNISSAHVSIKAVDIGLAQLAMHSSFETAGSLDIEYLFELLKAFYN